MNEATDYSGMVSAFSWIKKRGNLDDFYTFALRYWFKHGHERI